MRPRGDADTQGVDDREFANWLRSRGVQPSCPWCEHTSFRIGDSPLAASIDDGCASGAMSLICVQCGHIGLFAPTALFAEHDAD